MRNITVGIDVGSSAVKIAVAEFVAGESAARIIGTGVSSHLGLRRGAIINKDEVILAIRRAKAEAERASQINIRRALISISCASIGSLIGSGQVVISRADSEVTTLDLEKVLVDSESNIDITNKKILHMVPLAYKLDGKSVGDEPLGMKGVKLEIRTLFITVLEHHYELLTECVSQAGIDVVDVIFAPLAEAEITLSERHKIAGSVLIDMGGETTTMAVFENGIIVYAAVAPLGGNDITNDLALGFQTSLEEAEGLKIGSVYGNYPKKKLDEIIFARLTDIFEFVDNNLKKIKRSGLLPAGAIITGGGAQIPNVHEVAKSVLKLPARIGEPEYFHNTKNKIKDASWFAVYGVAILAHTRWGRGEISSAGQIWGGIKKSINSVVKQLMP